MNLRVEGLRLSLPRTLGPGRFRALDDVALVAKSGERIALMGASASGKSLVGLALLGLAPPGGLIEARRFEVEGVPIDPLQPAAWRSVRGRRLGWVPQEPRSALDPLRTVRAHMEQGLRAHGFEDLRERAYRAFRRAGLEEPESIGRLYPHMLSGGMAQRVVLALALALEPVVLVADEPTTALDPIVRAEVLATLSSFAEEGGSLILITHDLDVIERFCSRGYVLYGGRIVEEGCISALAAQARHPFVHALWWGEGFDTPLPDLEAAPTGCAFHPVCPRRGAECSAVVPELVGQDHRFACHHPLVDDS